MIVNGYAVIVLYKNSTLHYSVYIRLLVTPFNAYSDNTE